MKFDESVFKSIAEAMLSEFLCVYYINAETSEFLIYSAEEWYRALHDGNSGKNYFEDVVRITMDIVYYEDRYIFLNENLRELLLYHVKSNTVHLVDYRLMVDGRPVYHRSKLIRGIGEDGCFILGVLNVDNEVRERLRAERTEQDRDIYDKIAKTLSENYETLYYVDIETDRYFEYSSTDEYKMLNIPEKGDDFFGRTRRNIIKYAHPEDAERISSSFHKDIVLANLVNKRKYGENCRFIVNGRLMHCRCTRVWLGDNKHILVGVEDITDEINRSVEQMAALDRANELARSDGLTGMRNVIAYREFEKAMQKSIDTGHGHSPFAIVICDINDLKRINDLMGHNAGDEHIRSACRMITGVFAYSPVFRVGGDEFAVVLAGSDYNNRVQLINMLKMRSKENLETGSGPVVAAGLAVYDPLNDSRVSDVFNRADDNMYENKSELKAGKPISIIPEAVSIRTQMPAERKRILDGMFEMLETVNEKDYVYICDMRYDYSRWSQSAVDTYGLPSVYMYNAGGVWEKYVHNDDVSVYHEAIGGIFNGTAADCDVQYRVRRLNGEYSLCSGKGIILRDANGEPEYFIGRIRDHGRQSDIDDLTGLRNQYGFFKDAQENIILNKEMRVTLVGISGLAEINSMYGYSFGNLVLQKFGRYLYDYVGVSGNVYRMGGTRFAVINLSLPCERMVARYEDLRSYYRDGLDIDGRHIMLELNASVINVNNFSIDPQTILTCLTSAYGESKNSRHGDMVVFSDDFGIGNRRQTEILYAIRASITRENKGFYLVYQPVVNAKTEKIIGAEALIRWHSDVYGVVPPDRFIELLEQDPLFPVLGEWILTTAVQAAKRVLETDPDFTINVNLAYSQIEKPDFVDMVMGILESTGYPPGNLCLEITERCRMLDMELLRNTIINLRGKGVRIALDDFCTGFSSIDLVKRLPFDTIKIDRSFIDKIEEDIVERELISSLIHVATTCGAVVCIEGIETSIAGDILREFDVHSFQGYYYSKPLDYNGLLGLIQG